MEKFQKNGLVLKVIHNLQNFLCCWVLFSKDKKRSWLWYPFLIANHKKQEDVKIQCHDNHGTQDYLIIRPGNDTENIYWGPKTVLVWNWDVIVSCQATLPMKIRHCLCSCMVQTWQYSKDVMNDCVIDSSNLWLKLGPIWNKIKLGDILYFSDSNYAGNSVTERSVCIFLLYIFGVLVWSKVINIMRGTMKKLRIMGVLLFDLPIYMVVKCPISILPWCQNFLSMEVQLYML